MGSFNVGWGGPDAQHSSGSRASPFSANLFSSMYGADQMVVDTLKQVHGQEDTCRGSEVHPSSPHPHIASRPRVAPCVLLEVLPGVVRTRSAVLTVSYWVTEHRQRPSLAATLSPTNCTTRHK
jgi:hypothetical protein